ncbi:hypothetical protein VQ02_11510 [Methylobacterium variabile]|uniref:DUF308 domain-containing protein n=1 Tax=Methylobacterium variabile TaxID=298794 RepID=A0A0J6SYC0_9HYPH|nr:hypothetical protein VQ02_11510 [Methylobacterium variabile]
MFVLALLMLLGGLAAMVQGIPFVRLEVGWTMVIAGTVGASGGAVLLGITAVAARLGRIERALSERASDEAAAAPVRAARSEPILPPAPFPAAPLAAPGPRPAEPATPTGLDGGAALAAGAAVAGAGLAASELRLTRADDHDLPAGTHGSVPEQAASQEPVSPQPAPQDATPQGPASQEPFSQEASPREPSSQDSHFHEPTSQEPSPQPPAEERTPEAGDAREAEPAPEPGPEMPPAKTVIGTYDSGGNTYTMYADGTIDAETPAGRFHFRSIDELKEFRNAGGEGAARTGSA